MAIKTIKTIKEGDEEVELLPLWRDDDDDKAFMEDLFTQTLALGEESEATSKKAPKTGSSSASPPPTAS